MQTPPSSNKRRGRRILLWILSLLLIVGIAFQLLIDRYLVPIIHQRLEKLIVSGSDSLYRFELDKIRVSFWTSSVALEGLRIQVDSSQYAKREKLANLPALTFSLNLTNGSVRGIGLLPLIMNKTVSIESIFSKNADILLSRHFRKSDKQINESNEPLWKLIQPEIKSVSIGKIILDDLNIRYTNADSAKAFKWKFENCSAIIDNTRIDSAAGMDKERVLFSKNLSIQFKEIKLQTADGLYAIEAKKLWYSSAAKKIEVEKFRFYPTSSIAAFYNQVGIDKDRFNLDFPEIQLINFHLPQWINFNILAIDTVNLGSPQVNVYKDKTMRPDPRIKFGQFPHQLLEKLPFILSINRIHLSDAQVTYIEKSRKSGLEGKLNFHKLNGYIRNITNEPDEVEKNPNCVVDLNGFFMQSSPLHATFILHLNEAVTGGFEVKADIGKLTAAELNPITQPLAQASIKSLEIQELHYNMTGNERNGRGHLRMLYKNLAIDLGRTDEEEGKMKKRKLLSFLVNKFVVYPDNPKNGRERSADNIETIRNPQKSFFNHIWKNLFNAFKDITIRIDRFKADKALKKK